MSLHQFQLPIKIPFSFLRNCGKHLTHLSLGHCDFVEKGALEEIAKCSDLVGAFSVKLHCRVVYRADLLQI